MLCTDSCLPEVSTEWGPVEFRVNACGEPDSASQPQGSCSMEAAPTTPLPPVSPSSPCSLSVLCHCLGAWGSAPACAPPLVLPSPPRSQQAHAASAHGGPWEYVVNWMTNPVPTRQCEMAASVNFQMCPELTTSFSSQAPNRLSREAWRCSGSRIKLLDTSPLQRLSSGAGRQRVGGPGLRRFLLGRVYPPL